MLPMGMRGRRAGPDHGRGVQGGLGAGLDARLDSLGMTQLQLVTLASIVEGEARADDERETIAGVYHNRLRIGMALQADPTVQYASPSPPGSGSPGCTRRTISSRHRTTPTCTPASHPGPVNSPRRRSLEASLYPAPVPYLYFVAGPDGRHLFARTYAEHLRNIATLRRGR